MNLLSNRFDGIDKRFDEIDRRFDGIDKRFDGMDKKFDQLDDCLSSLKGLRLFSFNMQVFGMKKIKEYIRAMVNLIVKNRLCKAFL